MTDRRGPATMGDAFRRAGGPTVRSVAHNSHIGWILPLPLTMKLYGGTDKLWHRYAAVYQQHFRRHRFKRNVVFEIGVGGYSRSDSGGGSLRVWRDYFPRSTIIGIDIYDKRVALGSRVHFVQADQSNRRQLQSIVERFGRPDIVIDDGSHRGVDQLASFEHLWPQMREGGLYVVEDLHTSYWPEYQGAYPAPAASGIGLARALIDGVQSHDVTFGRQPPWGPTPVWPAHRPTWVSVYPGLWFARKGPNS